VTNSESWLYLYTYYLVHPQGPHVNSMASGLFTNPSTLLRIAPLMSSSCAVWSCFDQYVYWGNFLHRDVREKTNDFLPAYWDAHLWTGVSSIIAVYSVSFATGIANAYSKSRPAGARLYLAGAAFSVAHFLFVPFVAENIRAMVYDGNAVEDQRKWLRTHVIRSFFVDVPGWLCFGLAVLRSVKAI